MGPILNIAKSKFWETFVNFEFQMLIMKGDQLQSISDPLIQNFLICDQKAHQISQNFDIGEFATSSSKLQLFASKRTTEHNGSINIAASSTTTDHINKRQTSSTCLHKNIKNIDFRQHDTQYFSRFVVLVKYWYYCVKLK